MTPNPPEFTPETISRLQKQLLHWYGASKRTLPWRQSRDPYAIWVSEVMLQQTQVKTVIPYYLDFMAAHPDIRALARADLQTILKSWEGLGYYARARNFHRAANIIVQEMEGRIPKGFDRFKTLPGVGDYIASAVQSIAFGHAHAVVDGNVKRVLARLLCMEAPVNTPKSHGEFKAIAETLLFRKDPGSFNQALMELGALVCTPKSPDCGTCPISNDCLALISQAVHIFPKRIQRKKTPTHPIAAGIVRKGKKLLITRRKPDGLLGGLWEFPGGKMEKNESPEAACAREILEETGLEVRVDSHLTRIKHAYTHFKIELDVFFCTYIKGEVELDGPIDYKWVFPDELKDYPFPRANLKFIPLILNLFSRGNENDRETQC